MGGSCPERPGNSFVFLVSISFTFHQPLMKIVLLIILGLAVATLALEDAYGSTMATSRIGESCAHGERQYYCSYKYGNPIPACASEYEDLECCGCEDVSS